MAGLVHDDLFRRLCRARDLLHDRFDETLTLEWLARSAGLSRFHFLRLFHVAFGHTPHEYLVERRLVRASEMLARDEASVTDVCMRVGYSSLGSFSSSFARRFGDSPSAYRRRVFYFRRALGEPALVIPYCFLSRMGLA